MGDKDYIEIELNDKNQKIKTYFIVYPFESEIWADIKYLPQTVFFCACYDVTPLLIAKVGKHQRARRIFLPISWLIDEWGGPKDFVDFLVKSREKIIADMERYKDQLKPPSDTESHPL